MSHSAWRFADSCIPLHGSCKYILERKPQVSVGDNHAPLPLSIQLIKQSQTMWQLHNPTMNG